MLISDYTPLPQTDEVPAPATSHNSSVTQDQKPIPWQAWALFIALSVLMTICMVALSGPAGN